MDWQFMLSGKKQLLPFIFYCRSFLASPPQIIASPPPQIIASLHLPLLPELPLDRLLPDRLPQHGPYLASRS